MLGLSFVLAEFEFEQTEYHIKNHVSSLLIGRIRQMRSSLWLKGSATLRTSRRSTLSPHSAVSRATRLLHRTGIVGQSQTAAPRNETHPTGSKKGQGFFNSSRFRIAADSSQALQKWPKQFIITSSSPHTTVSSYFLRDACIDDTNMQVDVSGYCRSNIQCIQYS